MRSLLLTFVGILVLVTVPVCVLFGADGGDGGVVGVVDVVGVAGVGDVAGVGNVALDKQNANV